MIIWLNGAFGAGKTSVAGELVELLPGSVLFDPGQLTAVLRRTLPAKSWEETGDIRDLPAWRRLVVEAAAAVHRETGATLVVPGSLLDRSHRDEIFGGLAACGLSVRHLLLHVEEAALRHRLRESAPPGGRRADSPGSARSGPPPDRFLAPDPVDEYLRALGEWLALDAHAVDAAGLTPRRIAQRFATALGSGAGLCPMPGTPRPTGATVAAGVLFFDEDDRVLLVDPVYKAGWEFPGGVVEPGESPARAAIREIAEELGLRLTGAPSLLVVDWEPPRPPGHGGLRLLFDGGVLPPERAAGLLLPPDELRAWRFADPEEAERLLSPNRVARLRWAIRARAEGRPLNLEAGEPIGPGAPVGP
ncbi:NUDIX domain-containing protein [Streptomyces alkaliphilus]|uniref:NUDIX domain-containing protein n=1 Tax=Streptomyces alkaliphilus TaxID=1472722 RepID=A0A7W3Y2B5_9ACTN|nr:NUDIX domain-containing protein [Streptomyces alkaliphilus]MBB0245127.1 NUDIX domain-containing protein [Streptomyces alkaliphilus]